MFAFVIPVAGVAVSSNVAVGGGVTVAAAAALGAAEYKYKAPSRAITHVYNKLLTIYASQAQREEAQRIFVENAFNELMGFKNKSRAEISIHIATINDELNNRRDRDELKVNTEITDALNESLIVINCLLMSTLQINNKIMRFQFSHKGVSKIDASDPRYVSKISQMSDAENEILQELSNVRVKVMDFFNEDMKVRLRSDSSVDEPKSLKI